MTQHLQTSVIGSYPLPLDSSTMMQQYFSHEDVSWEPYITTAVQEMLATGVDLVSDGQTRDPMIELFTRRLSGCRVRNRTEIIGKILYHQPITIDDQKLVRQLLPKKKGVIGILTGPFTLARSCVDLYYHDEQKLALDFAEALRQEAEHLEQYVDLISIDEPCFANDLPPYAHELLDTITNHITCHSRLHVCGDVSSIVPQLLDMPVSILSHEFKASPHLFDSFKHYSCTKQICLGSVRSDDPRVEPIEEIVTHINKGLDVFGKQIVQIAPDCGQRYLPHEVAFQKLKNLVQARGCVNG